MRKFELSAALSLLLIVSCKNNKENPKLPADQPTAPVLVEVQGHRGDRGNFPENSIPAFISAVKKGVEVIELDVVVSKDKKVVVSHEPYMHELYMRDAAGDSISREQARTLNLYQMDYDSIKTYDGGSMGNTHFPAQTKLKTYKPLLSEVVDTVKNYVEANGLEKVKYNIEIKSSKNEYGVYQPEPGEFIDLVMEVVRNNQIENHVNIQSFDPAVLNILRERYPEIEIAYLVSGEGILKNLGKLDFTPEIYSPNFKLVKDETFVDSVKNLEMKLIPWTVNNESDIERMLDLKVDGIITDFPELVMDKRK